MTNRLTAAAAATALVLLATGCGPSFTVRSDRDPNANFAGYETFGWIGENPLVSVVTTGPVSPLLQGRLMDATRAELEAQGYRFVENGLDADFVVAFTVGSREQIRVDSYPSTFHSTSSWSRSSRVHGFSTSTTTVRQTTRGQLAIDIFDVASRSPVWHGTAETSITSSVRDDPQPIINEAVKRILAEFG